MCLQPACMAGCGETATRRAEIHDWEQEIPFAQQIARQNLRVAQRFLSDWPLLAITCEKAINEMVRREIKLMG